MAENPKVFISYSHDSPEHKRWVSELAARLRHNGIDAILDQWDLGLGDDITRFMERGIVDANRVLVICTDKYVSKANADEGGVGYERMIVNAELVQNLGTDKFIPIIRQASGKEKTPTFLGTRVYADFTNDSQFDAECEKLIRELHEIPIVEKPPLGKNPFPQLPDILEQVESASDAYKEASKYVRTGDVLGWRELIKQIKTPIFETLVEWRENELDGRQSESEEPFQVVDEAVEIVSPLIAVALAGVKSGRAQFRDQKALLDDLQNLARRNLAGVWVDIPRALGYVYHSLHGSISLSTSQLDLAMSLARVKIPDIYTTEPRYVWEMSELMGWAKLFGPSCVEGWNYLANVYKRERWEWLSTIFGDESEYQISLVAYYMTLNIHELALIIASSQQDRLSASFSPMYPFHFDVPLTFMSESQDINQRAISLLLRNPEGLSELWTRLNVTREQMESSWRNWVRLCNDWLRNVYEFPSHRDVHHWNLDYYQKFFDHL